VTATSATQARLLDGRYELRSLIGQGTFGRVYRGHDQRLDRAVAVKVIKPWWTEDREWAERFEQEARLMARVSHPGIVQIYDIGYDQGSLYYVAELVDGESLADRLGRGPLPHAQVRRLAGQLCRALAAAHAQRVVHRDVKPENVLLDRGGRVKVGDFGIARLAEASSEAGAGTIVGTPRYMAPEQARGHSPTPATDVYGAGVVLYEMLAGKPPFTESSAVELAMRHLSDAPPPLPDDTPPALAEIAERALAKEPAARYSSGREMADALAGADLERPTRSPASTRVAPRRTPRINFNPVERRRYLALLAVVIAIVVGMGAAAILTSTSFVRVPDVHGLTRAAAVARARTDDLRVDATGGYSSAPVGTVIAQRPAAGVRVGDGSAVLVTLSAGPPPVQVPQLVGEQTASAQAILSRAGLGAHVTPIPAPGVTPGLVVAQSPPASKSRARGSVVDLSVAETPRWRPLTSFQGTDAGQSVPFRIRGSRWRIVYSMDYPNGCSFIFFCSGPNAQPTNVNGGAKLNQFSLNQGSGQTQVFNSGPGVYQIAVTPGSDSANWSIQVEDDY
jgi:serine/threonine-protein kinase